jgi:hypothetical protein
LESGKGWKKFQGLVTKGSTRACKLGGGLVCSIIQGREEVQLQFQELHSEAGVSFVSYGNRYSPREGALRSLPVASPIPTWAGIKDEWLASKCRWIGIIPVAMAVSLGAVETIPGWVDSHTRGTHGQTSEENSIQGCADRSIGVFAEWH